MNRKYMAIALCCVAVLSVMGVVLKKHKKQRAVLTGTDESTHQSLDIAFLQSSRTNQPPVGNRNCKEQIDRPCQMRQIKPQWIQKAVRSLDPDRRTLVTRLIGFMLVKGTGS